MKKFYLLFNTSKEIGESGEAAGANYDMVNACTNCGTGYKLIGNLPVKAIKFKRDFIETLDRDYLISENLYSELRSSDITMNNLLCITDGKLKKELPYYHLNPEFCFPRMNDDSEGIVTDEQCPVCKQNDFFDQIIYPKDEKDEVIIAQIKSIPRKYKYSIFDTTFLEKSDIFYTKRGQICNSLCQTSLNCIRKSKNCF
jgi:hypothetical protein